MICQADGKGFSQSTGVTYMYELVSQETNANMLQKNHEVLKYMGDNSHLKALQRWEDGFVMQKHYSKRHGSNIVQFIKNVIQCRSASRQCDAKEGHRVCNDW